LSFISAGEDANVIDYTEELADLSKVVFAELLLELAEKKGRGEGLGDQCKVVFTE
jgi:hypothetical protein